jgi:serine/threonine protein kinase
MLQCPRCHRQFPDEVHVCSFDFTPLQADITVAEVPVDPLIGKVFDEKYRLEERLGGGGMGTVYRATHLLIDRQVALKVLSQRFVGDETAQQRFRREARAAGRMQHPNAVTVTDFGTTSDGYLYIVMEQLEGRTLRELLAREAPLDPARAVSIMLQAAAAVAAAHEAGLIHRDLKPANIFIEQRPNLPATVKVLDFGVAKFAVEEQADEDFNTLTQVGAVIGTPRYMSPEQCSGGGTLTAASDVYSLGIILYEMLTGNPPFSGDTSLAVALRQVSEAPTPPHQIVSSVPEELEQIVLRALAKNPTERPANADEFRRELHNVASALGFEHASAVSSPTMDELRRAGTESPSGRLVIDLGRLRQVQAASGEFKLNGAFPNDSSPSSSPVARKRDFARVDIPLDKGDAGIMSYRARIAAVLVIGLIIVLASVAVASRWWNSSSSNSAANQHPSAAAATPTPEPSPSPSPIATPTPITSRHERRPSPTPPKKESKAKSIVNKIKSIFR